MTLQGVSISPDVPLVAPLVLDFLGQGKLSIGPPYFNAMFAPIMSVLAVVLGFGLMSRWKDTDMKSLLKNLRVAAILSVFSALTVPFLIIDNFSLGVFCGVLLSSWILSVTVTDLLQKTRYRLLGLRKLRRSYYGMMLGHIGFAVMIVGVSLVSLESQERDVRMAPGDSVTVAGYEFRFMSLRPIKGPNFNADRATFDVYKSGEFVTSLLPEKRTYFSQQNPMTEAGIDPGLFRDLYLAMGEPLEGDAWAIRVQYKPFIRWIWLGPLLMAFGGMLSVSDKRYRAKKSARIRTATEGLSAA